MGKLDEKLCDKKSVICPLFQFFDSTWNCIDLFTVVMSLLAIGLYLARLVITRDMTQRFNETKGNEYIR